MQFIQDFADWASAPTRYSMFLAAGLAAVLIWRKQLTHPFVFTGFMAAVTAFFVTSWNHKDFNKIVTKPDNVPIVAMVFLLGFFTWLSAHRAVQNDERTARGEAPQCGLYDSTPAYPGHPEASRRLL